MLVLDIDFIMNSGPRASGAPGKIDQTVSHDGLHRSLSNSRRNPKVWSWVLLKKKHQS